MLLPSVSPWLAFASLLGTSLAHNIQLGAHSRECFHEELHKGDRMTVTFQVGDREFGGSGNLEIDFIVRIPLLLRSLCRVQQPWPPAPVADSRENQINKPTGAAQIHESKVSSGDHSFEAGHNGRYTYCFSNEAWAASTKEVSFNVHGIVYVPESEAPSDPLEVQGKIFQF